MIWVRRETEAEEVHGCSPPTHTEQHALPGTTPATQFVVGLSDRPAGRVGDLWRCDDCGKLWRVGRACDICDRRLSGAHAGQHPVGLRWRPARWWQRLVYGGGYELSDA